MRVRRLGYAGMPHRLDFVEVYSREFRDSRMIPDEVEFMVAFVVDDISEALAEVEAAGLEVVGGRSGRRRRSTTRRLTDLRGSSCVRRTVASTRSSRLPIETVRSPRQAVIPDHWPSPESVPCRNVAERSVERLSTRA